MSLKNKVKRDIESIIEKGSELANVEQNESPEWKIISLRITDVLLDNIQKEVKGRIGMNRNAWILEAIQEKLRKQ